MIEDMRQVVEKLAQSSEIPIPEAIETNLAGKFLQEYADAAAALGYAPEDLESLRFEAFCAENGIPTYDQGKVKAYLDTQYGGGFKLVNRWNPESQFNRKAQKKIDIPMATWGWRPIHNVQKIPASPLGAVTPNSASQSGQLIGVQRGDGGVWTRPYTKAIPAPVLLRARDIKSSFPDAVFVASDEFTEADMPRISDPFLGVIVGGKFYIVDKWDEPGFRG